MGMNDRIDNFLKLQDEGLKFSDISKKLGISDGTLRNFLNKQGYKSIKGKYVLKDSDDKEKLNIIKEDSVKDNIVKEDNNKNSKAKNKKNKEDVNSVEQLNFGNVNAVLDDKSAGKTTEVETTKGKATVGKSTKGKVTTAKTTKEKATTQKGSKAKTTTSNKNSKENLAASKPKTGAKTNTNKSKSTQNSQTKNTETVKKTRTSKKINVTQDDIDKLCEVYDWYLQVKDYADINIIKEEMQDSNDVLVEKDSITEAKSTTVRVEKDVWNEFERLCSNSNHSKAVIITQALKDFMKEYKNLL